MYEECIFAFSLIWEITGIKMSTNRAFAYNFKKKIVEYVRYRHTISQK